MLQQIREHTSGWIAGIIVVFLAVVFALWGVGSYFQPEVTTHVAMVNGKPIQEAQFRDAFNRVMQQARTRQGEAFDLEQYQSPEFKQRVLEDMITEMVVRQTALDAGYTVSNQLMVDTIKSDPAFQTEDGQFDSERSKRVMRRIQSDAQRYQQRVWTYLMNSTFERALYPSALATERDVTDFFRLTRQSRDFSYVLIDASAFKDQVEVTPEEAKSYYQQHPDEFMTEEKVSIRYLEVSAEGVAKDIPVEEAALRAYFADNRSTYLTPEQRLASHILIQVPADATKIEEQAALSEAKALVEKLRDGGDFAKIAKAESDDVGTAAQGGDLGWIGRGQMGAAFGEALFALEPGAISDPVRTSFGYHIIKLRDVQEPVGKSFAEARAQVAADFKASQAEREFLDKAGRLVNLVYKSPSSLQPAAQAMSLELQTTEPFTRNGAPAGVASHSVVVDAAFSETVLKEGMNSQDLEIGANHIVVLRVAEHFEPQLKPLAEVKDDIRSMLLTQGAQKLAEAQAKAWVESMQGGQADLGALAEQEGFALVDAGTVRADEGTQGHPAALLEEVFKLAQPASATAYYAVPVGDTRYAVVALSQVTPGDGASVAAFQRTLRSSRIARAYATAELEALKKGLRAKAEVKISRERL